MKMQLVATLALLAVISSASADIYRWVDAQGRVQYSDRPVPGSQRVGGSKPTDPEEVAQRAEAAKEQREKTDAATREKQTNEGAAKTVQQDVAKVQAERCEEAQKAYKVATESQRLYREGADGERVYLTNEEITKARIDAAKNRDLACAKKDS